MASVTQLAQYLIDDFVPTSVGRVDLLIAAALTSRDVPKWEAASEAEARASAVLAYLHSLDPKSLPFEFSLNDDRRVIGKQRPRPDEPDEATRARRHLHLTDAYLAALRELGPQDFEFACAAAMGLAGASEANAIGAGDEGGIDVYGRIPVRGPSHAIPDTVITSSILNRDLLFLGQCKCLAPGGTVSRDKVSQFHADVEACLAKYEGIERKPKHRVPDSFYRRGEACLKVVFTTGLFERGARGFAEHFDIILVDGRDLGQFLLYNQVALDDTDPDDPRVDVRALRAWAGRGRPAPSGS